MRVTCTILRILKFGTNVGYNLLHCVKENQHPPAYHSLYLSIFLSLQAPMRVRISKFCIHLDSDRDKDAYCVCLLVRTYGNFKPNVYRVHIAVRIHFSILCVSG